jgi:hypothetical protein
MELYILGRLRRSGEWPASAEAAAGRRVEEGNSEEGDLTQRSLRRRGR